jgi:hypothetical protein
VTDWSVFVFMLGAIWFGFDLLCRDRVTCLGVSNSNDNLIEAVAADNKWMLDNYRSICSDEIIDVTIYKLHQAEVCEHHI